MSKFRKDITNITTQDPPRFSLSLSLSLSLSDETKKLRIAIKHCYLINVRDNISRYISSTTSSVLKLRIR